MIGIKRTLIITCGQYGLSEAIEHSDDVSYFFLSRNMLQRYDIREKDRLQAAIEKSGCTQVMFLGVLDEEMQCLLDLHSSLHSLRSGLRFKTPLLPGEAEILRPQFRNRALLEQHVETQCGFLMGFHFIAGRVKNGTLSIFGVVGTPELHDCKTVFRNGVRFNDLVSMN